MSTVVETQTDYEIGQDNVRILGLDLHNPVFFISAVMIVGFVILVLMFQEGAAEFFGWLRPWLTSTFDWLFMAAANIFVLFCLFLIVSPYGKHPPGRAPMPSPSTATPAGSPCCSRPAWGSG